MQLVIGPCSLDRRPEEGAERRQGLAASLQAVRLHKVPPAPALRVKTSTVQAQLMRSNASDKFQLPDFQVRANPVFVWTNTWTANSMSDCASEAMGFALRWSRSDQLGQQLAIRNET